MKKIGLTLGKYAPFHKGHQYLFDLALSEVDELFALIYTTTVSDIPLSMRARWIRKLYPNNVTVLEGWDGPEGYSRERAFEILQEQYIFSQLKGRTITHFYSSEFYGEHVSKALNAVDRRVDTERSHIPISATMIRSNPFLYRDFVSPLVYSDLITRVVFVGAMATGKTTIVEALAKKYNTTFAHEYGRDYWTEHQVNRRIALEEFDTIAKRHLELEDQKISQANKYLFVDTNAITTYMYCLDYHGCAPEYLTRIALENAQRYDLFFLCEDDIPYDDTWDRSGPQKRRVFQLQIIADLKERRIPYIALRGNLEQRMAIVDSVLAKFKKYRNYFGALASNEIF